MDWRRWLEFALLGSSHLEQYAILLVRVLIGLFFAISGANKLFVAGGRKLVYETLVKAKIPFPQPTAYFVSGVEFVCGSLVTVGFLSSPACVALLIDMIVATLTTAAPAIPKGVSPDRRFPLPSGGAVRALLHLADLFGAGKVQC
jgi:putative oxidoreductase